MFDWLKPVDISGWSASVKTTGYNSQVVVHFYNPNDICIGSEYFYGANWWIKFCIKKRIRQTVRRAIKAQKIRNLEF